MVQLRLSVAALASAILVSDLPTISAQGRFDVNEGGGGCFIDAVCRVNRDPDASMDFCFGELGGNSFRDGNGRCIRKGSGSNDPHFVTWEGHRFSYQGECDLVMLHHPTYDHDLGMDVHIRTTASDDGMYSAISAVAVQLGSDTLEAQHNEFWINGELNPKLPAQIGGRLVTFVDADTHGNRHPYLSVDLGDNEAIKIQYNTVLLAVRFQGTKRSYGGSLGLMGTFDGGMMVGRDGMTTYENDSMDEFAEQWQVLPLEAKLFHDFRAPQLPKETCRRSTKFASAEERQRHLMSKHDQDFVNKANEVCGRYANDDDFANCVFDVLATGDLDVAFGGSF